MTAAHEPILELRGVNKSFGVVHVLHDVELQIYPGEVTALVGDNGAGKSTLVKAIAGIYPIDTGTYLSEGKPVTVRDPNDVAALGIEIVSTRTWRCATTSTSCRTCLLAVNSSAGACWTRRPWSRWPVRRWRHCRCGP